MKREPTAEAGAGAELPVDEIEWGTATTESGGGLLTQRRLFGSILTLFVVGMIILASGGAVAHTSLTAADVTVVSNSGKLVSLSVAPAGDIHFSGLEQEPTSVNLTVYVKKSSASTWESVDTKSIQATGLEGSVNFTFASIDLLQQSSLTKSDFEAADGQSSTTDVDVKVGTTLVGAGPNGSDVTASSQATFTVTVENVPAGGAVGGTANTDGS